MNVQEKYHIKWHQSGYLQTNINVFSFRMLKEYKEIILDAASRLHPKAISRHVVVGLLCNSFLSNILDEKFCIYFTQQCNFRVVTLTFTLVNYVVNIWRNFERLYYNLNIEN